MSRTFSGNPNPPGQGSFGTIQVTDAVTSVKAGNKDRKAITIINEGGDDVRLGNTNLVKNDADGSADEGLLLSGSAVITLTFYTGQIFAIAQTGKTPNLSFFEEIE